MVVMPKVSIGMPVRNGGKTLKAVIESLLGQTFGDFELIISDNNSDDQTEIICREYLSLDSRIRYIRQIENLGSYANFQLVFKQANSDYFMWSSSDDMRPTDFIEKNITFLSKHPTFVGSTSPNCFENEVGNDDRRVTFALDGTLYSNLRTFLKMCWQSHGIFMALFRHDALSAVTWPQQSIMAADWLIIVQVLFQGPINRVEDGLIRIGHGGISDSPGRYSSFQYNLIDYLFPLSRFSQKLLKTVMASDSLSAYEKMKILSALMRLNWSCKCKTG